MAALTFLGTGGGVPMVGRFHSSLLLETDGRRLLLDAGEPCSGQLKKLGVPFSSLNAVLLSHGHSDHVSGLPMVIQGAWLEGRRAALPVYLPGELIAPLRVWLEAVYLPEELIGFALDFRAWEKLAGKAAALPGGLHVAVHPTSHLEGLRAMLAPFPAKAAEQRFHAYSMDFVWADSGKRLVYSGDLGRPSDLEPALREPCDLLVCEITHFEPDELFDFLRDKPVRRLCLTHLSVKAEARAGEIVADGRKMLPRIETLAVMHDGTRIDF